MRDEDYGSSPGPAVVEMGVRVANLERRLQAQEREFLATLAGVVAAAGGEVRVPSSVMVRGSVLERWDDPLTHETVYRTNE